MKTTLLRLSRRAACLVLAGGLLTSCSLLPAASPRHEGTASSQAPQYYSDAWLSDDSLHYVYSYAGNGGGTILRGGRVLYKASSSDSIQLLKDTLTGETGHYLVAHSTPGTEERTSTLYDADGNAVMTFPYAVSATLSGGLLILRDDADVWAFENGTTGGIRVYDLATGAELPVPETALDCLVVDEGGQRLVFNCYDLPEGLTYAYDDPDQPLHQYVLITDREGNVLMREDGCTASSLASYRGGFADWLDLSWFRGADWGIAREALYNVTTGELLTGEEDSAVSGLRMVAAGAKDGKVIAANMWGKVKTVLQMLTIIFYYFGTALTWGNSVMIGADCVFLSYWLCWLVAIATAISGIKYLWDNRSFINTAK